MKMPFHDLPSPMPPLRQVPPPIHSTFAILNEMVDGGHLANLTEMELRVFLVFLRHADKSGIAYPGPETIAAKVG